MAGATAVEVMKLIFDRRLAWKGRLGGRTDFNAILLDVDECRSASND
jgi:hypothetical protein